MQELWGTVSNLLKNGAWDLRLKQDKEVRYVMRIPRPPIPHHEYQLLKPNPQPKVDFSKISLKQHLSKELSTYSPQRGAREKLHWIWDVATKNTGRHANMQDFNILA